MSTKLKASRRGVVSEFEGEVVARGLGARKVCAAANAAGHVVASCCDDFVRCSGA
jgi:hypothetical protein